MPTRWPDWGGLAYIGVQAASVLGVFGGIPAEAGPVVYAGYAVLVFGALPVALIAGLMVRHSLWAAVPWHGFTVWWFVLFGVWHASGVIALLEGASRSFAFSVTLWFSETGNLVAAVAYQTAMAAASVLLIAGDRKRADAGMGTVRSQ
ncbi:hypothetical protein [Actinokineospora terrae]|uniref:Uncharacterized protein n=1 Tax=Actinokineospora terrae TaxID=155974 RepID=A0A1H9TGF3_9PSEU|nr:hypothetical protein [Actinokineospora terrae]SER96208.1 hypothetical protein SAMN04487818_106265 [Actinokineospora terrae]